MPADRPLVYAVDDEPDNLSLVCRALGDAFTVETFVDPRECLSKALRQAPAILVVDYRMPHLTGTQLIDELQKQGVRCPAIIVTAFADLPEVADARRRNVVMRVISKPYRLDDLRAQVGLAASLAKLDDAVASMKAVTPK